MGKIYGAPKEIGECPSLDFKERGSDIDKNQREWTEKVQEWCRNNGDMSKYAGEKIRFQVADGYAEYIVLSLKPVKLIWLPIWDKYQFQYADRLTAKDIKAEVERIKAIAEAFNGK